MAAPRPLNEPMVITVTHECEDGWHIFTSAQMPGLFLTGRKEDLQEIYEGVPTVIADLARADFGREVMVSPEKTYSSYLETLPPTHLPPVSHYTIRPQAA